MRIAVLDADGVLDRYRNGNSLGENEVEVHDACDLVPGRYKYVADLGAFFPVPKKDIEEEQIPPNPLRMIAKGFRSIQAAGVTLDKDTAKWLDDYERTFDGAGISKRG